MPFIFTRGIKKYFLSLVFGLMLLTLIVLPSIFMMVFNASSMAGGLFVALCLIICTLLILSAFRWKSQDMTGGIVLIIIVMCVVMIHGVISYLIYDNFDSNRFLLTYFFLLFFLLGAFSFAKLTLKVTLAQADIAVKFVFYILLLSSIAAILNFSPFSSGQNKPVFFFYEPSHFALSFLPFLLYIIITSASGKFRILLCLSAYSIALLLESFTLVVGVTIIACLCLPLRQLLFFISFIGILIALNAESLDHYVSRVDIFSDNLNLTTLVYLSGWESAFLNVKETFGIGVGFQQLGVFWGLGEYREILSAMGHYDLNLMGGGFVGAKLIGEFGVLGIVLLLFYLSYCAKIIFMIRKDLLGVTQPHLRTNVFFYSFFVMYGMDLFFRGTGYFSSSGFLFLVSLMWIVSINSPNYLWVKKQIISESTS